MRENAGSATAFVIVDTHGRVVAASEGFTGIAGRGEGELVGEPSIALFDPSHQAGISAPIASLEADEPRAEGCGGASAGATTMSRQVLVAQEAERKRIAADLHDGLGQLLGAAKFGIESALGALSREAREEATASLTDVSAILKRALDEVRRIAMNLRPSTLDDLGILATLSWFLREFGAIYQAVRVEGHFTAVESDVPDALKLPIFRVVQEAMSNVAKHSHASRARVSLERAGMELRLVIEDDGVGFDAGEVASRRGPLVRFGHSFARERVESSGGSFALHAAPGEGVRIAITWPLPAPEPG